MIRPVYIYGSPILRKIAQDIDSTYPEIKQVIEDMFETMHYSDGIGLAAPQIGLSIRLIVIDASPLEEDDPALKDFNTMMVKTHLSLTHDPAKKGVPKGWILPVRDVLIFAGAKFLCPMTGAISLMPGTSSDPAYRRVDVDVETGKVKGLF